MDVEKQSRVQETFTFWHHAAMPAHWPIALCVAMLAACGTEGLEGEDVAPLSEAITGGTLFTSGTHAAPDTSVVMLVAAGKTCTATKVGPRRFLTAAHCGGVQPGKKVFVSNALNPAALTELTVSQVLDHPTAFLPNRFPFFDVELIDVVEPTAAIPTWATFRPTHVPAGTEGDLTAYGCDTQNPGNGGRKQWGHFTAKTINDPSEATLLYYENGGATTCSGDSGGPLFIKRNNVWEIAGVVAANNFARVSHVLTWIQDPRHNVFSHGSRGFLINRNSEQCLGVNSSRTGSGSALRQFFCDGRDAASTASDHQYWELVSVGDQFKIKNTKSGNCLSIFATLPLGTFGLEQASCSSASTFGVAGTGEYRALYSGTLCLSVSGLTEGTAATVATCDWVSSEQLWLFSR